MSSIMSEIWNSLSVSFDREKVYKIVDIRKCIPNEWNPNVMSNINFDKLKRAIDKKGSNASDPILIRPIDDWNYQIIDWFHRWRAMQELWFDEIVATVEELDDKEARIRTLAKNKFRGEPDQVLLANLINSLRVDYWVTDEELAEELWYSEKEIQWYIDLVDFDFEKYKDKEEDIDEIAESASKEVIIQDYSVMLTGWQLNEVERAVWAAIDAGAENSRASWIATMSIYFRKEVERWLVDTSILDEAINTNTLRKQSPYVQEAWWEVNWLEMVLDAKWIKTPEQIKADWLMTLAIYFRLCKEKGLINNELLAEAISENSYLKQDTTVEDEAMWKELSAELETYLWKEEIEWLDDSSELFK